MPNLSEHDNKVYLKNNADTEVWGIPVSSASPIAFTQTYTPSSASLATPGAATAPTTVASFAAGTVGAATIVYGFQSATQADAVAVAVAALVTDIANVAKVLNKVIDQLQAYGISS